MKCLLKEVNLLLITFLFFGIFILYFFSVLAFILVQDGSDNILAHIGSCFFSILRFPCQVLLLDNLKGVSSTVFSLAAVYGQIINLVLYSFLAERVLWLTIGQSKEH